MSSRFQPYPEYQSTGLDWLGRVPNSWELRRLGSYFRERREKVSDTDYPALSVTMQGIVPQLETAAKTNDGDNRKLVRIGDFAINSRSDRKGSSGVSRYAGSVSLITIVLQPLGLHPAYVHHLFRSEAFQEEFYRFGKGIVADLWSTNFEAMKNITIPVMSTEEQKQIAAFLDYETAKIDSLIEKQQQLIALLGEKRQAVISHAVTKGLNPDAPMRDSGVDWLGEVPEHWKVHSLKYCAADGHKQFTDGDWIESPFITTTGVRLLQTGNVGIGEFREQGFRYISEESFRRLKCTEIFPQDLLICRLDGPVGRACLVPNLGVRMITSVDNAVLKPSDQFDSRFLVYLMTSTSWLGWIENIIRAGGGFRYRISRTMLGDQKVTAPPIEEQRNIADLLDEGKVKFDSLLLKAESAIELLHERRTSLISAAVTGKVDVRGWQRPSFDSLREDEMGVA